MGYTESLLRLGAMRDARNLLNKLHLVSDATFADYMKMMKSMGHSVHVSRVVFVDCGMRATMSSLLDFSNFSIPSE